MLEIIIYFLLFSDGPPVKFATGKSVKASRGNKQTDSRTKKALKRPWSSQFVAGTEGQPPGILRPSEYELVQDTNILFPITSEICIGCMNDSEYAFGYFLCKYDNPKHPLSCWMHFSRQFAVNNKGVV